MITGNIVAGIVSSKGTDKMFAYNPVTMDFLPEAFSIASMDEVHDAAEAAYEAWKVYKTVDGKIKALFLRTIAEEIEGLGDTLVDRVMVESGLPQGRVIGERGRTCGQLRLFADLVEEGSWVDATIDEALPDRAPIPRPDIRRMSSSIGPIAVFGASNFPLAFSTAGGDTASALAAGCPVIVKAHPSHLGTNALVSEAITNAVKKCKLPKGVFSMLNGQVEVGQNLVKHPFIKAVAFTGSYHGGMAIAKTARERYEPIPVYAEMGSNNLIFVLPDKMKSNRENLANTIANSVNLGAGQFCTNPGIIVLQKNEYTSAFLTDLSKSFQALMAAPMLNESIHKNYESKKDAVLEAQGVESVVGNEKAGDSLVAIPGFAKVSAADFVKSQILQEEIFGPFTLLVLCDDAEEMQDIASNIHGQLTGTVIGNEHEILEYRELVELIGQKVGRLLFNGVPTGVEVCHAMHHGGPFPATSNGMYTSVGTDSIKRFVRPIAYQNAPEMLLPDELKPSNPLGIWRTVNGEKRR